MRPAYLLDANVLLALASQHHAHHARAKRWFEELGDTPWATCTVTELAFIRLSSNPKVGIDVRSPAAARNLLADLTTFGAHTRWAEPTVGAFSREVADHLDRVIGHRQVTDAYLVALASSKGGRVATFDAGMRATWGLDVELIAG